MTGIFWRRASGVLVTTDDSDTTDLFLDKECALAAIRRDLLPSLLPLINLGVQSLLKTLEKLSLLSSSKPLVTLFLGLLATGISLLDSSSSFLNLLLAVLVFATFSVLGA